jgi:hypothetical protein
MTTPQLPLWIFPATRKDRARIRLELHRDAYPTDRTTYRDPDTMDAWLRADQTRRLEVWVGCVPEEFSQHDRPDELLGLIVQASDRRRVLCTKVDGPTWLDDLARVSMFHLLDVDEWNEKVCPRCRCDATVRTDEGLWWCKRHATRAWEPIEHREGVAWQEQRLVG